MPKTIKTQDGIILNNVPDNVSDDEIKARIQAIRSGSAIQSTPSRMDMSNISRPEGSAYDPYNPTVGMSGPQKFLAGAGKALTDIYRGGAQVLGADNQADIDASRLRDAPLMETGAGLSGNIAGNVAAFLPTAMIPGANTVTGSALIGGAIGAMQPTTEGDSRLGNVAFGAAGGAAGQKLANALSRVVSPQTAPAVKELIDQGVTPTPGQTAGGIFKKIESAAESLPFIGTGITNAKVRANTDFNLAALNRIVSTLNRPLILTDDALRGNFASGVAEAGESLTRRAGATYTQNADDLAQVLIGSGQPRLTNGLPNAPGFVNSGVGQTSRVLDGAEQLLLGGPAPKQAEQILQASSETMRDVPIRSLPKITQAGHAGIIQARELVDQAYKDALSVVKRIDADSIFNRSISKIQGMSQTLTAPRKAQLNRIIQQELLDKLTPAGSMSGRTFKTIESQLKKYAATFLKNQDFDQQQMGHALNTAASELRALAGRSYPQAVPAIKRADEAYAQLLRIENAAGGIGAKEGIFSPAQLAASIRGMDNSLRKLSSAQGTALMQDFAQTGKSVLGETLPNSGTADRAMSAMVLGGGYMIDPMIAGGMLAGRGAYTPTGQRAIVAALAKRPEVMRRIGTGMQRLAAPAAVTGSTLATQQ